ncbi:hypothetical protein ACIPRL_08665 [Streptomyces sp. NPDC090085]|uniref:hypothetical protein n=1 Tax=Streptomyces sp. NPDC090085 TaxID=3365943 RepID=UPI003830A049
MTQRLDPGAGWYGEFLRRDPEGVRACLDGAAIPPWDVVESLLRDLEGLRGTEFAARETVYAARLRAAAVAVWDRLPGGAAELRTQLGAAAEQRAASEAALRGLTVRLREAAGGAGTDALARELSWTQDDVARAVARHEDLSDRLAALVPPAPEPAPAVPAQAGAPAGWTHREAGTGLPARDRTAADPWDAGRAGAPFREPDVGRGSGRGSGTERGRNPEPGAGRGPEPERDPAPGRWFGPGLGAGSGPAPGPGTEPERGPVREPESGWSPDPGREPEAGREAVRAPGRGGGRGARRGGGARYAGAAVPEAAGFALPPGLDDTTAPPGTAPRGARFGRSAPRAEADPGTASLSGAAAGPDHGAPPAGSAPSPPTGAAAGPDHAAPSAGSGSAPPADPAAGPGVPRPVAGELIALRAQGRTGEAHALLCEAAAWPAERLPRLAVELTRSGLAADWAALLWEAASLPPHRFAAAAAALAVAGREADCEALLRQGVARPAGEVADVALALGEAGHDREADSLLTAFVRVRTPEEAADLARRAPGPLAPRLLRAARALPGARHRDLLHALRVAGIDTA